MTLSSCILHFDSNNASHTIPLICRSGQNETNCGPIESNCGVCENDMKKMTRPLIVTCVSSGVTFNVLAFHKIVEMT